MRAVAPERQSGVDVDDSLGCRSKSERWSEQLGLGSRESGHGGLGSLL